MSTLKKSLEILKQRIIILLPLDIIFFTLVFFLLVYAREKLKSYILAIQAYTPQIMAVQQALAESTSKISELESVLNVISPLVQKALIFQYVIIPLALFLLWCIFQSLIWKEITEKIPLQRKYTNYFLKFILLSIPIFLITLLFLYRIWQLLTMVFLPTYTGIKVSLATNIQLLLLFIITIIIFYFTLLSYSLLQELPLKKCIKKAFHLGIKRIHILGSLYILFLFLALILMVFLFSLYVSYLSSALTIISLLIHLTGLIIPIIIMLWLKIIITLILQKKK